MRYPVSWLWRDEVIVSAAERIVKPNGAEGRAWIERWRGKGKLSFLSTAQPVRSDGAASRVPLVVKLFLPLEAEAPPGCRAVVVHQGREYHLKDSGVPAVLSHHQELLMEVAEEWA